ncbi:hypothetical protein IWQ61_000417 [Dispira simplex]|nr:hypothetical protein IWQ61_000417 [Dispira simplex]
MLGRPATRITLTKADLAEFEASRKAYAKSHPELLAPWRETLDDNPSDAVTRNDKLRHAPAQCDQPPPGTVEAVLAAKAQQTAAQRIGIAPTTALRQDLPRLFGKGLRQTYIYTPHMTLVEPCHTHLHLTGKLPYLWFIRILVRLLRWSYTDIDFRILRMEHRPGHWYDDMELPPSDSVKGRTDDDGTNHFSTVEHSQWTAFCGQRSDPNLPQPSLPVNCLHVVDPLGTPCAQCVTPQACHQASLLTPLDIFQTPSSSQVTDAPPSPGWTSPSLPSSNALLPEGPVHLYVRWSFEAILRPSLLVPSPDFPRSRYDGIFIYSFDDRTGWVTKHSLVEIFPSPSQRFIRYLERWWWWAIHNPAVPKQI